MVIEHYQLPKNWAHYLIYGEQDGYDEGEVSRIRQWERRTFWNAEFWDCVDVADDCEFMRYHDATNVLPVAAECLTFAFHTDRS